MKTKDIALFESGNGGNFIVLNNDLLLSETLYQQIYLALFGGNIEASTKQSYLETEDRFDYWGNSLVWKTKKNKQFNSETEAILRKVALNSSGRLEIVQAINSDLAYLSSLITFDVEVSILSSSSIRITVSFTDKTNQESKVMQMVYNNAKNEVIIEKEI